MDDNATIVAIAMVNAISAIVIAFLTRGDRRRKRKEDCGEPDAGGAEQ